MNIKNKLHDLVCYIIDKCADFYDKRKVKKYNERNELIKLLAKEIAKTVYDSSDNLEYFRNQTKNEYLFNVSRFTVKVPWLTKKQFHLLTDDYYIGGGETFLEVGGFNVNDIDYEIRLEMNKLNLEGSVIFSRFSERKIGVFRDFDGYNIYLELYRRDDINKCVIDKIIDTLKRNMFILEKLEVCGGIKLEIPVTLENKEIQLIKECDFDDICENAKNSCDCLLNNYSNVTLEIKLNDYNTSINIIIIV